MTAHELRKLREEKHQSPRSMADALGININTYYGYERGKPIPRYFQLAIKFLATQDLPKAPSRRRSASDAIRAEFAPGRRFGRLVVVGIAPHTGGSRHRRVQVQCDCGEWKVMRATSLAEASECGYYCPLKGTRFPSAEATSARMRSSTTEAPPLFLPNPPDPDEPDLEAPDIEWLKYNDRKEREKAVELKAASGELNLSDNELEAGL